MRLIDADSLKDDICKKCCSNDCKPDATDTVTGCYLLETINNAPTVEAEPVKHGQLVNKGAGYIKCSVCGQIYTNIVLFYKCCPYCTARFDVGVKDA